MKLKLTDIYLSITRPRCHNGCNFAGASSRGTDLTYPRCCAFISHRLPQTIAEMDAGTSAGKCYSGGWATVSRSCHRLMTEFCSKKLGADP